MDQLGGSAGQTSWTDRLDEPAGQTSQIDQLDGPAGQTSWMDQFSILETLTSLNIQSLTFQFVHCCSFRVWRRSCFFGRGGGINNICNDRHIHFFEGTNQHLSCYARTIWTFFKVVSKATNHLTYLFLDASLPMHKKGSFAILETKYQDRPSSGTFGPILNNRYDLVENKPEIWLNMDHSLKFWIRL